MERRVANAERKAPGVVVASAWIAIVGGAAVLVLRILRLEPLDGFLPGAYVMKANTAFAFVLTGVGLALAARGSAAARLGIRGCALLVIGLGAIDLVQGLLGWNLGIERRMAPVAALNFVLLGSALLSQSVRHNPRPAQLLALASAVSAGLALLAYAYESAPIAPGAAYARMAVTSTLLFWVVAGGILFLRPHEGMMAVVTGDSAGGVMLRRLLPATIILPVALGWLRLAGEQAGLYRGDGGVFLLVACNLGLLLAILGSTAASLHRSDGERRRTQAALALSEQRYRRLTESSLDAIVVADQEGRITLFNRAAEQAFGYTAAEVEGRSLSVLMPPDVRSAHEHGLARYVATRDARLVGKTVEVPGQRKDGTQFPVELSLCAVDVGDRVQFIGSLRDLTERHRMRAAMIQTEKLASIGLLSAGVAHEINNPLAYVANNLAVLERDTRNLVSVLDAYEDGHDRLAEIDPARAAQVRKLAEEMDLLYTRANLDRIFASTRDGVQRVTRIVQAMRGMARSGPPKMETARLADLVDMSLELVRGRLARRKIAVELDCGETPQVRCASSQLAQVLLNLVVNAVQAVEATGRAEEGRIRIGSHAVDDEVVIEVSDNGCGIAKEDIAQVFDPFFTTKDVGEGTGLGLAISHGIVAAHGGRIEASSEPGRGSCFRVFLPQHESGGAA